MPDDGSGYVLPVGFLEWAIYDLLAPHARVTRVVPVGTEIFPYSSESGAVGIGRLITMELAAEDPLELTLPDPATGKPADFYCLPLGENPTTYDSYLVRARDVEPA